MSAAREAKLCPGAQFAKAHSANAARVSRYRKRVAEGGAVLRIEVADYHALVDVLITSGWLQEGEALDRKQVEAAVSAALQEMAQWQRNAPR